MYEKINDRNHSSLVQWQQLRVIQTNHPPALAAVQLSKSTKVANHDLEMSD